MMKTIVVIGTGGTIAGVSPAQAGAAGAPQRQGHVGYQAGVLEAEALLAAVPVPPGQVLEAETLARLDSSDMDHATWLSLARRCAWHLARPGVSGVVVTHGTDTLEETAYFLHRTVQAAKPLVLTAAMRPASALSPDGPQNLADAVLTAGSEDVRGVLAVLAGRVHAGAELRKVHGFALDAFSSGDAGVLAMVEDGALRSLRSCPARPLHAAAAALPEVQHWPRVDIVTSHAGAQGRTLDALVASGARGVVIAGTGNGSVHAELLAAARRAQAAGVRVWRSSRCVLGGVVGAPQDALVSAGTLTPVQARIELMLDLMTA